MRFSVLGPLVVADADGAPVDVGGRQPRVVVVALVAASGRPVPPESLVEAIWGEEPPKSALGTLQTYVSRLRRTLEERGGPPLVLTDAGYVLDLEGHEVDVVSFERLAAEGGALLAAGRVVEAREALTAALARWRGPALAELVESGAGVAQAAGLEERRTAVLEQRIETDLALGRHADVVADLQALVAEHPLREGLHGKLALALYRSGRQADALRALAAAGERLREDLGLEPSRALSDLEAAILAHDPSLDPPAIGHTATAGQAVEPPRPARIPLVGRETELGELLAALVEATDDSRFVVIEGDPGIGKTRLADELAALAAAEGSLAAWGRADESGAAPALWPWLPVLRATTPAALDDVPPLLADVLAAEAPLVAGQGPALQFERFEAIADVLERAGKGRPAVVLLDDLQWADPASLDLLQFLAARLRAGVLVVVTVRATAVGHASALTDTLGAVARRHGSRRLRLHGLPATATGTLLEAVSAAPVDPQVATRIHERAEGNPFYAIELARLLGRGDAVADVPASVRDAVRRRLRLLPEGTLKLLTVAAAVGRDVDLALLAGASRLDAVTCAELLDPAASERLLEASPSMPGGLRFGHALVREVLLEELTPLRRAGVHLAVADAMADAAGGDEHVERDRTEALAGHLWRAVPLGVGARAAAALERAAETAISRVAYVQAEELLGRAAQLRRGAGSSPDAKQAELTTLLRLLEVMQAIRYFSGTDRDVLHRAMELAGELGLEDVTLKLEWSEWAALSTAGELAQARPMAEQYLARWCDDPRPNVCIAANVLFGVDEWSRGHIPSAIAHLDRAIELLADAPPPADAFEGEYQLVAHAFSLWSHAAHGDVSVDEALAGFDFLLAVVPPAAVSAACAFGGAVAAVHTRWDDLDRLSRHALGADPAAQFAFFGGQLLMQQGVVSAAQGDLDEGVATFLEGRSRYRAVGGRTTIVTLQSLLAEHLARAGRVAEANELLVGARRQAGSTGETWEEITLRIAEVVVAAGSGDTARAAERFAAALAEGERSGMHALGRRAELVAADLGVTAPA